jgi:hypothetical protein
MIGMINVAYDTFQNAIETMASIAVYNASLGTRPDIVEKVEQTLRDAMTKALEVNSEIETNDRAKCCQRNLERIEVAKKTWADQVRKLHEDSSLGE